MNDSTERRRHASTFWFGFAMGTVMLGAAAVLLGTKRGRETLQKVLDLSENLEENIVEFAQETEELVDENTRHPKQSGHTHKPLSSQDKSSSLSGILNKMHFFSQPKPSKKVFMKDSK